LKKFRELNCKEGEAMSLFLKAHILQKSDITEDLNDSDQENENDYLHHYFGIIEKFIGLISDLKDIISNEKFEMIKNLVLDSAAQEIPIKLTEDNVIIEFLRRPILSLKNVDVNTSSNNSSKIKRELFKKRQARSQETYLDIFKNKLNFWYNLRQEF
jgi:hypothetical protein